MFVWDTPTDIAIDGSNGDIVVVGCIGDIGPDGLIIDISDSEETLPSAPVKALRPSMVDIIPAAETPDLEDGNYLGFGDSVVKGPHLKVEAALPAYLKQSDNSTLAIKIFIAAQMPDDYSRLAYFDSSNNLKFQPLGSLSSWKSSVRGAVSVTTVSLEVGLRSESSTIPSGTHYWCALVVPATVPDDFSGVDWSTTPWEITVNILDVQ